MLKILHAADLHVQDKDIVEIKKCLFHMVKKAAEEKPDIIIVAGDLFDSYMVKLDSQSAKLVFEVVSNLADIAPVAIVIGTPSHEGSATEVLRHIKAKYNVWVSERPEQLYLINHKYISDLLPPSLESSIDAVISMMPTPTKKYFQSGLNIAESDQEISTALSAIFAGFGVKAKDFECPHILAGHISMGGAYISETQQLIGVDIEISKDQIALANADVVCLGHIHLQQKIEPNIFYSGSIYRENWGELEEKGFYFHDIEYFSPTGKTTESTFHLTPTRKLIKIAADMTAEGGFEGFNDTLSSYPIKELQGAFVRVELKVFQDEVEKIDQKYITDFLCSMSGVIETEIKLIRVPRENVRSTRILELTSLPDKLIEQANVKGETLPQSIIDKAIDLESKDPNEIIKTVASVS
jgi:exonuclease SbcD